MVYVILDISCWICYVVYDILDISCWICYAGDLYDERINALVGDAKQAATTARATAHAEGRPSFGKPHYGAGLQRMASLANV